MPEKLSGEVAVVGIDIGKNSFHVINEYSCDARPDHTSGQERAWRLSQNPPAHCSYFEFVGSIFH
jgi:hypothetical protein